ncbi:MAG: hypothetical protein ACI9BO_002640, partial [Zhongshania sp.]
HYWYVFKGLHISPSLAFTPRNTLTLT